MAPNYYCYYYYYYYYYYYDYYVHNRPIRNFPNCDYVRDKRRRLTPPLSSRGIRYILTALARRAIDCLYKYVGVEHLWRLVNINNEGSEKLVAVASAAGTWTDSAHHPPG